MSCAYVPMDMVGAYTILPMRFLWGHPAQYPWVPMYIIEVWSPWVCLCAGTHCYALAIMLCMDKIAVGRLKQTSVFPLYMVLMNQLTDDRYHPSSMILVGYLPHFQKQMIAGVTSKQWSHLRTTRNCLAIFLEASNYV